MACEDFPCCGHETPSDCSMTEEQYQAEQEAIYAEIEANYWN
jgi:hypothetical protein